MTLLKGRKHRNWWPHLPTEPARLGLDRRIMGVRILPNGKRDKIGLMGISHPSMSGTTDTPKHKRRTFKHLKGKTYPGQWKQR